ncbi:MAG: TlyA family RNA methyltransferase [Candidatus Lokiarchaeota archaeon]|nr:TlyA family RNA methyltransferase [Candidatus Lokiarchaeota archaeon]
MKERLDIILVDRRLVESRTKAQWLIKSGFVLVNDMKILKASKRIEINSKIKLIKKFPYVGRGGIKLEAALKSFLVDVEGKICVDIGASVGGFTDCLLQQGALKVYTVDTGPNLLHPSLTCKDDKIVELFGVDARELKSLPEIVNIVTVDLTFSSLRSVLPNIKSFLDQDGDVIVLVKPLFETNFHQEKRFKIIKDLTTLKSILTEFLRWSKLNSLYPKGLITSPLLGKGGSIEFLVHIRIDKEFDFKPDKIIDEVLKDVKKLNSNLLDNF